MPLRQRRRCEADNGWTWIHLYEMHSLIVAVYTDLEVSNNSHILYAHPCGRREGRISSREQSTRDWRRHGGGDAITGRAHHRSSPHGCGFVYALAWWSGLSPCTSPHHLHGSSKHRISRSSHNSLEQACFMRVFRGTRITPTIKPRGACRRLTDARGG